MLSFITYKNIPEQLEIIADDEGIDDLINYLKEIKSKKDHMHLVIETELNYYPIPLEQMGEVINARHVRLEYSSKISWSKL